MTLRLLTPGLCTLVVDYGRPASRSLGVPVGGAADRWSLALGNALVGNPPSTAALEFGLAGPVVQAQGDVACVVYGAPFTLTSDRQPLAAGKTFTLSPGEELRIGGACTGMRAYLCVPGGFHFPKILSSRSSLGPLSADLELPCAPSRLGARFIRPTPVWNQDPCVLHALDGAQVEWFQMDAFYPQAFRVSQQSDRMGLRLEGQPLVPPHRELTSEPVCPGAVQVTRDGQCIVLGVDGQTIGGYPKIAQVISADLDKLGQLRPGDRIRFRRVRIEEAESIYHRKQLELKEWMARLQLTFNALAVRSGSRAPA
jgi:antagonist of KipI